MGIHGGLLYEAKVEATRDHAKRYRVHYKGWSKKYDEWVEPTRMLKLTDSSKALRKRLLLEAKATEQQRKKDRKRKAVFKGLAGTTATLPAAQAITSTAALAGVHAGGLSLIHI